MRSRVMPLEAMRLRLARRVIEKPADVNLSDEEWHRGVRVWTNYCTGPNPNWDRHYDMCVRLLSGDVS